MKKMTRFLTLAFAISALGVRPAQAIRVEQNEAIALAGVTGLVVGGVTYWFMDVAEDRTESSSGYKLMKFLIPVATGGVSGWGMYKVLQGFSFTSWNAYAHQEVAAADSGDLMPMGLVDEKGNVVPAQDIDTSKIAGVLKKRRAGNPHALPLGNEDLEKTKQGLEELKAKWYGLVRPGSDSADVVATHKALAGLIHERADRVADAQVALGDHPDFQQQSAAYAEHMRAERARAQEARQHAEKMALEREKVRAAQVRASAAQQSANARTEKAFGGRYDFLNKSE